MKIDDFQTGIICKVERSKVINNLDEFLTYYNHSLKQVLYVR